MPTGTPLELKQLGIGRKIRTLRAANGKSLDAFAEELGVSKVLLNQIEEDVVPPTVATLLNIAKLLNVGIDHFFTDVESSGKLEVTRVSERLTVHHDTLPDQGRLNYNYESLAYRLAKKHMEPFYVEFDANGQLGEPLSHDGEEFIYVLEGEIDFISGDDHVRLGAGDAAYFFANLPHTVRGVGTKKAKAIFVLYPYSN